MATKIEEMMARGILDPRQVQGLQSQLPTAEKAGRVARGIGKMRYGAASSRVAAGKTGTSLGSKAVSNLWWLGPLLLEMLGEKVIGDVRGYQELGIQERGIEQQTANISAEAMMQQMLMPMLMQESGGMEQMLMQVLAGGGEGDLANGEERIGRR